MLIKVLILVVLLAIIASLGSGLFFLVKDKPGDSKRLANSLTLRIVLSRIDSAALSTENRSGGSAASPIDPFGSIARKI